VLEPVLARQSSLWLCVTCIKKSIYLLLIHPVNHFGRYATLCLLLSWLAPSFSFSLAFVCGCSFGSVGIQASVDSTLLCPSNLPRTASYGFLGSNFFRLDL